MTDPLTRRDILRILAGLPVVIGAGGAVRALAGDPVDGQRPGDAKDDPLAKLLERALSHGGARPLLLIAVPHHDDRYHPETYARRQRIARRLAAMLESRDERTRLVLSLIDIVVADERAVHAAAPSRMTDPTGAPVPPRPLIWAHRLSTGEEPSWLMGRLDASDEEAEKVLPQLDASVIGEDLGALDAVMELELASQTAAREIRRHIADLGAPDFDRREAASAWLAERREKVVATLAHAALTAKDPEVRIRALELAAPAARIQPMGTKWERFHGGCVRREPYDEDVTTLMVKCGMAAVTEPARDYLRLVAAER